MSAPKSYVCPDPSVHHGIFHAWPGRCVSMISEQTKRINLLMTLLGLLLVGKFEPDDFTALIPVAVISYMSTRISDVRALAGLAELVESESVRLGIKA